MILDFFNFHKCSHHNVPKNKEEAYCPDCGELVQNQWFILRCSTCEIKREAHIAMGQIKPVSKFCPNCGATGYISEKLPHLNFIDVHYAVHLAQTITKPPKNNSYDQIWVDEKNSFTLKLLSQG